MRKLNLVFLAGLLAVLAALGLGIHCARSYQLRRNAWRLLERARRAEVNRDFETAAESLNQYLNIKRLDGPIWKWYARLVDQRYAEGPARVQAYLACEEALRHNPGDQELERRCADLALELERYTDARRHFALLHARGSKDSHGEPDDAELEDLLGQCERAESNFPKAETYFRKAIGHHPGQIASYDHLARMLRVDLAQRVKGDLLIDAMVKANAQSARAYLTRWRYHSDFHLPGRERDIEQALRLDPKDPDVLAAAAELSEQKGDLAAARQYCQKGLSLAPKNAAFPVKLAQLDLRAGHADQAEAVLRAAVLAHPKRELWYLLADLLIGQGKIDGKDNALDYIERLRKGGLHEGYLKYLEARASFRREKWSQAIAEIDVALARLVTDAPTIARLNVMLAECAGRLGRDEQRLAALRQAARDETTLAIAGPALARELARSGKLDAAAKLHMQLMNRRPESRLDLARLCLQKVRRQPREERNWHDVEESLQQAEKALPKHTEELTLLRCELLTDQGRLAEARALLEAACTKDSRSVRYRAALVQIARSQGDPIQALEILEHAEKELGQKLDFRLARLSLCVSQGGSEARAAIRELASARGELTVSDQPVFLEALARAAYRLSDVPMARHCLRELLTVESGNLSVMMALFDMTLEADDRTEAADLLGKIRRVEGEEGTLWRYGQAVYLMNVARRDKTVGLDTAYTLASEILSRRPEWWGGPFLQGAIAELKGDLDTAIVEYLHSLELGNSQPSLARRLVGLLNQRQDFDRINRVLQAFQERGVALEDLAALAASSAIQSKDFHRGVALARQAFPSTSTRASDHLSLGRLLQSAGHIEEAGKELRRAVELDPEHPDARLAYVRHLVQARQVDQARAAVEAARVALPPDRSTVTLAQCFALLGDSKEAEARVRAALAEKPTDPVRLRLAAGFYADQRRFDEARPLLNLLADPNTAAPASDVAWANRTRALIDLGSSRPTAFEEALGHVEQNLKANPSDIDDRRLRAVLLAARTSRRTEAIDQLEALEKKNGLGPEEQFLLACLYHAQGRPTSYRAKMLQILSVKNKNPRDLAHFVAFLIGRNALDEASHWLAELELQEPQGLAAFELRAALLKAGKQNQKLLSFLQERARSNPDRIGAVARLLERFGFRSEAEAAFMADSGRAPKDHEPLLGLAGFLARQNRPTEAIEILKRASATCRPERLAAAALDVYEAASATEAQRAQIEAWLVAGIREGRQAIGLVPKLATIRLRQGRPDEAEALLREALSGDPHNPQALNDLAWILAQRRDKGNQRSESLKESLDLINRAIDVAGENAAVLDTRAAVFLELARVDQALQDLQRSLSLRPGSRASHFHLARANLLANNKPGALRAFRRAEELGLNLETVDALERTLYLRLRDELRAQ
jgi:tetratricopeptide (TPR) repeat protein